MKNFGFKQILRRGWAVSAAALAALSFAACQTTEGEAEGDRLGAALTSDAVDGKAAVVAPDQIVVAAKSSTATAGEAETPESVVTGPIGQTDVTETEFYQVPDADITDDVVVDELGDEGAVADLGAGGARAECDYNVVSMSVGAVAEPCLTSDGFMRSLGLTDAQMEQVHEQSQLP